MTLSKDMKEVRLPGRCHEKEGPSGQREQPGQRPRGRNTLTAGKAGAAGVERGMETRGGRIAHTCRRAEDTDCNLV